MGRVAFAVVALLAGAFASFAGCSDQAPTQNTADASAPLDASRDARPAPLDASPGTYCANDASTVAYPPGANTGADGGADGATSLAVYGTAPNLSWDGLDENGAKTTVKLGDFFEPCAPRANLLVVRITTAWCGTCRYSLAHTADTLNDATFGARIRWLDLLVADEDGNPATQDDLARHRARIDAPQEIGADPTYALQSVATTAALLPAFVFIDTRTMQIRALVSDPDPALFAFRIGEELAILDGAPYPAEPTETLVDSLWPPNQWSLIQSITTPTSPPPDPTNEKADDASAAALGKLIFSDKTLSPSGTISCATCHDPNKSFTDGLSQSEGVAHGDRNAPSLALAAYSPWEFWDGRADSLWAQAAAPFENPKEFDSSRLFIAHQIASAYTTSYNAVWTDHPLVDMSDPARFPASGAPGDAAYDAMAQADKDAVTRVLADVAKSVAAYERTIVVQPNRLDEYAAGNFTVLSNAEKTSLGAFFATGCAQCHWGPRLTDDAFHVSRFPTGRQDGAADRGRIDVVTQALSGELNSASTWSDAPAAHANTSHLAAVPALLGAFKTPSLRGVSETAPYGHGGMSATLTDVVTLYTTAGLPAGSPLAVGTTEPWVPNFDVNAAGTLLPILTLLSAAPSAP